MEQCRPLISGVCLIHERTWGVYFAAHMPQGAKMVEVSAPAPPTEATHLHPVGCGEGDAVEGVGHGSSIAGCVFRHLPLSPHSHAQREGQVGPSRG
jgi:hypothetical protein